MIFKIVNDSQSDIFYWEESRRAIRGVGRPVRRKCHEGILKSTYCKKKDVQISFTSNEDDVHGLRFTQSGNKLQDHSKMDKRRRKLKHHINS